MMLLYCKPVKAVKHFFLLVLYFALFPFFAGIFPNSANYIY